ncbi:MAG: sulfurtransferase [Roseiflexaceae bacterium]|nr:sulfurtransferase [Roseiflexaceae bacterium]
MLVSTEWLSTHLGDPTVRPIDVRWYLTEPTRGPQDYGEAHIPGAAYLDLDQDLAAPPGQGPGRHPLPTPERFAAAAARAGISTGTHVVVYDASGGAYAARLWWLLRHFGHENVSLLDGGWMEWLVRGCATESGQPQIAPGLFVPHTRHGFLVDAGEVEALRQTPSALLLDARAAERYEGRVEPIDARAGHIPGAASAPFAANLREDGTFKSPDELRERFTKAGAETATPVVSYCGSGVTATHNIFAMLLAGLPEALLYEGSWSDWSSDPARPVATGEEPG